MKLSDANVGYANTIKHIGGRYTRETLSSMNLSIGDEVNIKAKTRGYVFISVEERSFIVGSDIAKQITV